MSPPQETGQMTAPGGPPALPTEPADEAARPGSSVIPAPEVLDGELITDAEYARRRGPHRLPLLAIAAAIRKSDRRKKVTTAVASWVKQSARVAARAAYTAGAGHASWARRAVDALTLWPGTRAGSVGAAGG